MNQQNSVNSNRILLIVTIIFIIALVLRLWGTTFGLPYEYHVDENQYVRQAATMGSTGLKPADWYNPPLFKYILLGEYGVFYLVGRVAGIFHSTAEFGQKLKVDPTWLYLLGRWTSALMGALTVLVTYWTGQKAYSRTVGLAAAFLTAVAFMPVREAHFAVNDAAAALWIALTLLASVGILKTGERRWYVLAGIALGLGLATKYHTLAAAVPLLVAHFFSPGVSLRKPGLWRLVLTFGILAVTACIASPYFLITPGDVWRNLYALIWSGQYGYEGWQIDPAGGFIFYLKTFLWALGWPLAIACLAGVLAALFGRRKVDWLLLSFPLLIYVYLGRQSMYFGRFMLPALPPLILVACAWAEAGLNRLVSSGLARQAALAGVVLVLAAPTLADSIRLDMLLASVDTRSQAKAWIEQNIPDGAGIAMDWQFHCPQLSTAQKPVADSSRNYVVWYADFPLGKGLSDHPLDWYAGNGYDYLVACSSIYSIPLANPQLNQDRQKFYQDLNTQLDLVKEFQPNQNNEDPSFIFDEIYGPAVSLWDRSQPGPTILIYRLRK